jgi:hypothetical protein
LVRGEAKKICKILGDKMKRKAWRRKLGWEELGVEGDEKTEI